MPLRGPVCIQGLRTAATGSGDAHDGLQSVAERLDDGGARHSPVPIAGVRHTRPLRVPLHLDLGIRSVCSEQHVADRVHNELPWRIARVLAGHKGSAGLDLANEERRPLAVPIVFERNSQMHDRIYDGRWCRPRQQE